MKLHIKYQTPGPSSFRQEDFKSFFFYMGLCKISPHPPTLTGRSNFRSQGYTLKNLSRGLQDKAIKGLGLLVSSKKIFKVSPIGVYLVKMTFPHKRSRLTQDHYFFPNFIGPMPPVLYTRPHGHWPFDSEKEHF